jgi:hypothetical protein
MRHRRRTWRPRLLVASVLLLAPSLALAQADEVIMLPTPGSRATVGPTAPVVPGSIPSIELSDGAQTSSPEPMWTDPGGRIIDNLPNAFADGALGGAEAEALVIGPPGRWVPRVITQYMTKGVGYDDSFLFLSGAVPLSFNENSEHRLSFLELTGGVSNHSEAVGTVEWVGREYKDGKKRVHGDYWSFDYRDSEFGSCRQLSFGDDWLGVNREARYNVYIPLGRNQKFVSRRLTSVPVGSNILPALQTDFETAMYGGDVEYGWRIVPLDKSSIWWLIGGYHFQAGGVEQVWGVKTRAELRLWNVARLSVEYQRDDVFHSHFVFAGEIVFPGVKPRGRPDDSYITDRLFEPIRRWRTITLARSSDVRFF